MKAYGEVDVYISTFTVIVLGGSGLSGIGVASSLG
jgi:hypothetical protein